MKKVVLAFSGGLDTSYCVKYLSKEKNLKVYSVLVNTGGFSTDELNKINEHAKMLGVKEHENIDVIEKYYNECIRFLIYGNVLKNDTYPLSVSAERVFQAMAIAQYAKEMGADYIAHGSTGAGNDQVRFDMSFNTIAPDITILTPIRDLQLSREQEIDFLKNHGVEMDWQKTKYSINQGLWGTSVGGVETLTSDQELPDSAYPTQVSKTEKQQIDLYFEKGEFAGFNGKTFTNKIEAIEALNSLVAPFGIGRDVHVGDTIIGIKGRVGFEAAAPMLIIKAHHLLEKHVLTKWQIHWKKQLADWYGMMLHEGHFLDPVMRDIESFLENTQSMVSGTVFVKLSPNNFKLKGIESKHDLMSPEFGAYGEMNLGWTANDVKGFSKIISNQTRIYKTINSDEKND
ncbi:MAG: argininosuccinate synthase [Calditrichaeota bacterium]|nr:MAG: argininosuccinate synthase [Calditrichota bacterium]MBL1205723.1 argininosuccinate synthase [Calditrichota bacterium]NOG45551.1 argininosuccinate synthase [Calditrichota bacterium]